MRDGPPGQHLSRHRIQPVKAHAAIEVGRPTRGEHEFVVMHQHGSVNRPGGFQLAEYTHQHVTRRGLVAVISDFYCDPDELIAGVRPLAFKGHDVILFQVLAPDELTPRYGESTLLEDVETGDAVEVSPKFMADDYRQRLRSHVQAMADAAAGIGADHVLLNTAEPLDQPLRRYLLFRQRRK